MSTQAYFTVPKALHEDPYRSLSVRARYLYAFLRDRSGLSQRNGWRDSRGVFVVMSRKSMAQLLAVSIPTARRALRELIAAGLLAEHRVGLTRCNKLYVRPLQHEETPAASRSGHAVPSKAATAVPSGQKAACPPERKPFPPNNPDLQKPRIHNPERIPYAYRPDKFERSKWPKGTVLAQQYTQRDCRPEDLARLIEVI